MEWYIILKSYALKKFIVIEILMVDGKFFEMLFFPIWKL